MKLKLDRKFVFVLIFFTFVCCFYVYENSSNESFAQNAFMGGDLVCYDVCIIGNNAISLSFPVISENEISNIELISHDSNIDNYLNSNLYFSEKDMHVYKDKNIYSFTITYSKKQDIDNSFNDPIKGIRLKINDVDFYYATPYFTLFNHQFLENKGEYVVNSGDYKITQTNTAFYTIPDETKKAMNLIISNKLNTMISITASSFLSIDNLEINGQPQESDNIYKSMKAKSTNQLAYSLNYKSLEYSKSIVKTAFIIKYMENGDKKIYVSNVPLYVFPGYTTNQAMENFIDSLE